jgi:hypothetical protein
MILSKYTRRKRYLTQAEWQVEHDAAREKDATLYLTE